jgi:hypothetical protein
MARTIVLHETERERMTAAREQMVQAQYALIQAEQAAIAVWQEVLAAHGEDPEMVADWRFDTIAGTLRHFITRT